MEEKQKLKLRTKFYRKKNKLPIEKFFVMIFFLFIFLIIISFIIIYKKKTTLYLIEKIDIPNIDKNIHYSQTLISNSKITIRKNLDEEYNDMLEFLYMSMNYTLYNPNETFHKSNNPKISIIIGTFNGEPYINNTLFSIQNQDFKDVEIIIVDDCSKDNTVNKVKELMKNDPRIILYQNEENKGTLYTKTKGVLNSNGKYIMILDQDDMYTQRDVFSTLYNYAEQNNLDILGFSAIFSNKIPFNKPKYIHFYFETPILYQPQVSNQMFTQSPNGYINRKAWYIWNYIFKSELFKNTIKQIEDKYINTKMNCHEDFILFFLLTRNAYNLKQIKRVFYNQMHLKINKQYKNLSSTEMINKKNIQCQSYINYIELLLNKTKNNSFDKNFASFELKNYYLKNECRNNEFIRERGKNVCKLFLENKYINSNIKNEIYSVLNDRSVL